MAYIIFRDVSTESLQGVKVGKMPDHRKAKMRMTEYYVKGRDGALHVDEGFSNFTLQATLVLINGEAFSRQIVNAWADGTGKLILSDQLNYAYRASVKDEIRWNRVPGNVVNGELRFFDTAQISFDCEPYMYEAVESVYVLTETGGLLNPGSAESIPKIVVEGQGDTTFSVNGEEITISGMTSGVPVTIDCETGYVYTPSGATTITGGFPVLGIGVNNINIETPGTVLTITPHWRWV